MDKKKIIVLAASPGRRVDAGTLLKSEEDGTLGAAIAEELQRRSFLRPASVGQIYFIAPRLSVLPKGDNITSVSAETDEEMASLLRNLMECTQESAGRPIDAVIDASAVCPYAIRDGQGDPVDGIPMPNGLRLCDHARVTDAKSIVSGLKLRFPDTFLIASVQACYSRRQSRGDAALDAMTAARADAAFAFGKPGAYGEMPVAAPAEGNPVAANISTVCTSARGLAETLADMILGKNEF